MAENNNAGDGGPVDPPGPPPPAAPESASTIEIANTALREHPLADSVAVATIADGFAVQVIYRRKDLR